MKRLLGQERGGVAILMVLSFMMLGTPVISSALNLADTFSRDSTVKTKILKRHYCGLAGAEYVRYLTLDPARWTLWWANNQDQSLPAGTAAEETITVCGGQNVTIDVNVLTNIPSGYTIPQLPAGALPVSESGREFRTTKTVQPQTVSPLTNTTFNYEINIFNTGITPFELTTIYDKLPAGLSYVPNSSADLPTNNPQLNPPEPQISGNDLKWENLASTIAAGQSVTLSFQAQGSRPTGAYCNEAWVDPGGHSKSTSGVTAKVVVGSPVQTQCPGKAVILTETVSPNLLLGGNQETFAYTISIENTGIVTLNLNELRTVLPAGFDYVVASSSGLSISDPNISGSGLSWELKWDNGPFIIPAGTTATQVFNVSATPQPGSVYFSQVWAKIDDLSYEVYTWPTAPVQTVSLFTGAATDSNGNSIGKFRVWVGDQSFIIDRWTIGR